MPFMKENVCVAHQSKVRLYAVGSLSHVSLLDSRDAKPASSLCSKDEGAGKTLCYHDLSKSAQH